MDFKLIYFIFSAPLILLMDIFGIPIFLIFNFLKIFFILEFIISSPYLTMFLGFLTWILFGYLTYKYFVKNIAKLIEKIISKFRKK